MRRIIPILSLLIMAALCTACGDDIPANTANVSTNLNTNNANATNNNGTTDTNTQPANTTMTNGNRGNTNRYSLRNDNVNLDNTNTSNLNNSQPAPTPEETDKITVDYPNHFLQDDSDADRGKVTFTIERVLGQVRATTNTNGNTTTAVDKPGQIKGAQPNTISPAVDPNKFDVYVEVKLFTSGLVKDDPPDLKRLYKGQRETWEWRLKPAPETQEGQPVSFWFQVNVTWQARTQEVSTKENPGVWLNRFDAEVGPPAGRVNAALYGSPLFAAGGIISIGMSRRRRKDLMETEPEEPVDELAEDEVSGTVYAPGQAAPGDSFLVQVFIHLPEQEGALDELARAADEDARRRISNKLQKKVKRGTELTFHLQMPGLAVDDDVQSCIWEGAPACVQFGVSVPEDCKPKNIIGTVTVSEASVPIGHLRFKFKIAGAQSGAGEAAVPGLEPAPAGNLTRYEQAFISYASKDRQEVLKRVQMLNVAKIKFFQDLLTLEPGDEWEKLLYDYIDKSDVFFLFWSKAASESEWVRKEVEYAIKRRANKDEPDPEIIPVIIEGPPAARPPKELSSIHFNDKLIYFINPRETGT